MEYQWPQLRELTGAHVWEKHEHDTPTGAFKVRGGLVYCDRLTSTRPHVGGIVQVSEDDAAGAMRAMFATTHNIPEPAGAMGLAGLLAESDTMRGRSVAVIQSGGNVDAAMLADVLCGRTPLA